MVSPFSLPLKNKSMDYEIETSKLGNGYVVLINKLFYQRIFFSPDQVRFLTRLVISDLFLSPRHGISIVSPPGKQIHGLYETEASTLGHGSVVLINELLNQRLFSSPDQVCFLTRFHLDLFSCLFIVESTASFPLDLVSGSKKFVLSKDCLSNILTCSFWILNLWRWLRNIIAGLAS